MTMYRTNVVAELIEATDIDLQSGSKFRQAAGKPGSFYYFRSSDVDEAGIIHSCPCGCGMLGALNLKPHDDRDRPLWANSGTRERPTLSPSVGIRPIEDGPDLDPAYKPRTTRGADGFHWHGWLRNGVWESV